MAKIVYACVRDTSSTPLIKKRIELVIPKLVPDNIPNAKCKVVENNGVVYGISTYSARISEIEDSVCMGIAYNSAGKWWEPGTGLPEGSYAIFRADEAYVEAITDIACSRAVWYYKDDDLFVAGPSQRASHCLDAGPSDRFPSGQNSNSEKARRPTPRYLRNAVLFGRFAMRKTRQLTQA